MFESRAFLSGTMLWTISLCVNSNAHARYIRVRVAQVKVHHANHHTAHHDTTHTLADLRKIIVTVRRRDEFAWVLRLYVR